LTFAHPDARRACRASVPLAAALLALAVLIAVPVLDPVAPPAIAAASGPVAVIVVGPVGSETPDRVREAREISAQLKSSGAIVREVYSPNATWSRVAEASRGAHLFVYVGAGRGHPGPYGGLDTQTMNGLGLNRARASGHRNLRFYGEHYIRRSFDLAAGAVVILNRVPYAAGSSEPGRVLPTQQTAVRRADNYASGFLDAGAAVVFAGDRSVTSIVRDLLSAGRTMRSVFWRSPWTSTRYGATFTSERAVRSSGVLAPYGPGRYHQSVVGRLASTTTDWRRTWDSSVRVNSILALKTALADNTVTEIVVANGRYHVSPSNQVRSDSLWIGSAASGGMPFAERTRPVTVRAETIGGVTFDGGGGGSYGGLSFEDGAHDQTWVGFNFANMAATQTGIIEIGGYTSRRAPHHITLRHITIERTCTGRATTADGSTWDHAIYMGQALAPGPHDLLFEDITVHGEGNLATAFHFYHGADNGGLNAYNVVIRRLTVTGTQQAILFWEASVHDVLIDTATISGAKAYAVRYEGTGGQTPRNIVLQNITSTNSGSRGFYSSLGAAPAGVSFIGNSLH